MQPTQFLQRFLHLAENLDGFLEKLTSGWSSTGPGCVPENSEVDVPRRKEGLHLSSQANVVERSRCDMWHILKGRNLPHQGGGGECPGLSEP